ncbi:MAG: class I SAM-dependent methyltransferase [Nitrospinota bacterium]
MAWTFPPEELNRLIRPQRYRNCPPFKTLRRMGLRKGMAVVDIGCGPGFWTLPAARIAGRESRVLACDISPKMLAAARYRASTDGVSNITFRKSTTYGVPFDSGCADFCLMNYVLHEVDEPARLLAEGVRMLRPGAFLAVYEWAKRRTEIGPPLEARIARSRMESLFRSVGLRREGGWRPDTSNYVLLGVRR